MARALSTQDPQDTDQSNQSAEMREQRAECTGTYDQRTEAQKHVTRWAITMAYLVICQLAAWYGTRTVRIQQVHRAHGQRKRKIAVNRIRWRTEREVGWVLGVKCGVLLACVRNWHCGGQHRRQRCTKHCETSRVPPTLRGAPRSFYETYANPAGSTQHA